MSAQAVILSQFRQPRGLLGHLAGAIMAHRGSNLVRNRWAVSLLDLQLDDQVLEVGFGPGIGIAEVAKKIVGGQVWGIDHSRVMLEQARRRNRRAIDQGKVRLLHLPVDELASVAQRFDKIFAINCYQFWDSPARVLAAFRDHLRPDGTLFLIHQPRGPGATEADVDPFSERLADTMRDVGFQDILIRKKAMRPISTLCVSGSRSSSPEPSSAGPR